MMANADGAGDVQRQRRGGGKFAAFLGRLSLEGEDRCEECELVMPVISTLRRWVRVHRRAPNTAAGRVVRLLDGTRYLLRLSHDRKHRATMLARLANSDSLHQTTTLTWIDRYPEIFEACRVYLQGRENLRVLSFGCSTGEEVLTLRRYFPTAAIVGAEINRACLAECRRLEVDDKISFVLSSSDALQACGPFDAIFCMAVLQRTPMRVAEQNLQSLKNLYPFEKFDRQLDELDRLINLGGLLVVHYSHYLVRDACVADNYMPLAGSPIVPSEGPKFDTKSRRIEGEANYWPINVKVANRLSAGSLSRQSQEAV